MATKCLVFEVLARNRFVVALETGCVAEIELERDTDKEVHHRVLGCNVFAPIAMELIGEIAWDSTKKRFFGGNFRLLQE